jgi:glyoxylate/hydroxypyruvate reductase A
MSHGRSIAVAGPYLYGTPIEALLRARLPDWTILRSTDEAARDASVAVCWDQPAGTWPHLRSVRLIHSIGAGVDNLLRDPDLPPGVPVCRVVDSLHAQRMAEYVLWGALYFHRGFDIARRHQQEARWQRPPNRSAQDIAVGVMGLGEIGSAITGALVDRHYQVRGWSRSAKSLAGVQTFAGDDGLGAFLDGLEVLVCVLPLTPATHGILSAALFDRLTPGTKLIQCGRGPHLVERDLIAALDSGRLGGALVDVFEKEPLPEDHPLWLHPRVVVTPHMAAVLPMQAVVEQVADNAERLLAGRPLLRTVDRSAGY